MLRTSAVLALMALATPALAFEDFIADLKLVPGDLGFTGEAFVYSAPDRDAGRTWWPGDRDLQAALAEPADALRMTGLDFAQVTAVFETGVPPNRITVLHGPAGLADAIPDTLAARGFEKSEIGITTILTTGEDHQINLLQRLNGDPFMGRLGRSYRLGITDDEIVVGHSTDDMMRGLSQLSRIDCDSCEPWQALARTLQTAAGPATLEGAMGFAVASFENPIDPFGFMGSDTDISAVLEALNEPAGPRIPPFGFAIFGITRDAGFATAHIAVLFLDEIVAATAAPIVSRRLFGELAEAAKRGRIPTASTSHQLLPADIGHALVLSVGFDDPDAAVVVFNLWINMILNREFEVLAL